MCVGGLMRVGWVGVFCCWVVRGSSSWYMKLGGRGGRAVFATHKIICIFEEKKEEYLVYFALHPLFAFFPFFPPRRLLYLSFPYPWTITNEIIPSSSTTDIDWAPSGFYRETLLGSANHGTNNQTTFYFWPMEALGWGMVWTEGFESRWY